MRQSGIGLGIAAAVLYAGAAGAQDVPAVEPAGAPIVDPMPQARGVKWYDGFSITPGFGVRHFALHVDQANGDKGTLQNSLQNSLFWALDVQSPSLQFSEHWGASVYLYASNISLSEQFTEAGDVDENEGDSINVGTRATGRYSYVVPALHYEMPVGDGGSFRAALGFGKWFATVKGDIILTPDNEPAGGMPRTDFDVKVDKNAYLFHMQWRTRGSWHFAMSVGGPKWSGGGFEYQVEEVALVVGYALTPQTFGAP